MFLFSPGNVSLYDNPSSVTFQGILLTLQVVFKVAVVSTQAFEPLMGVYPSMLVRFFLKVNAFAVPFLRLIVLLFFLKDVSTTVLVKPGPVLDFLCQNQNVQHPNSIDWIKVITNIVILSSSSSFMLASL